MPGTAEIRGPRTWPGAVLAPLLILLPTVAAAQAVPAFGGLELRGGLVFPEQAEIGSSVAVAADLGWLWVPNARVIIGLNRFVANIDREPGDDEGSFTSMGANLSARYDLRPLRATSPYVRAGITYQNVNADAFDPRVGDLLDGAYFGAELAVGARRSLDRRQQIGATMEVRQAFVNNIGATAVEIGIRYQPRGGSAYDPPIATGRSSPAQPRTRETPDPRAQRERADSVALLREQARRDSAAAVAALEEAAALRERRREVAAEPRPPVGGGAESMLSQGLERATTTMEGATSIRETADAFVITIAGTSFPTGSGSLSSQARGELRVLATVLAGYPGHIVEVEGHTDSQGDDAMNQALSVERANAVRAALIAEGVDPLWVAARGFGESRPVADNATSAGRMMNRRVEIQVTKQQCGAPPRFTDGTLTCPGSD